MKTQCVLSLLIYPRNPSGTCGCVMARLVARLLEFCSLASCEANRVACVTIILSGIQEFWRRVGGGARAIFRVWWCVWLLMEVEFLGFHYERSWSMSVVLVSLGEASICINLIWRGTYCLGLKILIQL